MNIAIIEAPLSQAELTQLTKEFPTFQFLLFNRPLISGMTEEHLAKAEILFGSKLNKENLKLATQLRWIHCEKVSINRLCIKEIEERGNILITNTFDENIPQIAEFVLGGVLAFAKHLFHYKEADHFPALLWDCKWRNDMWNLKNKIFLQIGMEKAGVAIAEKAHRAGMKVFAMDEIRTFHSFATKNLPFSELHAVLPAADVISICLQGQRKTPFRLDAISIELMKKDSILSIVGPPWLVDENALFQEVTTKGKFRGILLDASYETPLLPGSKLWSLPNILITPDVAPRPKIEKKEAFRVFRYNLRQFLHGNFSDMINLIDPSIVDTTYMNEE